MPQRVMERPAERLTTRPAERVAERSALLYDTAASLRLLDRELRAFGGAPAEPPDDPAAPPAREGHAALGAAADILDALDRTQELVDDLEAAEADDDRPRARGVRARMREELFGIVGALRGQALAARPPAHAAVLAAR